jgi:TolB-like protein
MAGIAVAAGLAYAAWHHGRGLAPAAEAGAPSVAVLAFADMSPGKDQGYLGDGVAEEVLNGLAQVDGLRVVGRTTSFSYKGKDRKVEEIGRELGVGAVLEGSVRRSGDRVRITAQLVRTSNAATIWSQSFERNLADVFALQDEIGKAVVDALRVRLLPGKVIARTGGSTNPDALQQYLVGRDRMRTGDSPKALEAFEKAVAIDPRFALAWAGIANAIVTIEATVALEGKQARRKRAREAAEKAVELAPGLSDAWLARADVHFWLENDWRGQKADLERARPLAPGDPLVALSSGFSHQANGDLDAAIAEFERAVAIEPRVWQGWMNGWLALCTARISRGDHEQGRAACRRALELFPDYDEPRWGLGMDLIVTGQPEEALAEGDRCRNQEGYPACLKALALHDLGRRGEARAVLDRVEAKWGKDGAYQVAEIHAWMGDADGAFAWLERARIQRDTGMFWLKTDPLLKRIRGDPRWAELLRRAELPSGSER